MQRRADVVVHAVEEEGRATFKAALEGGGAVVPFANAVGEVTVFPEDRAQGRVGAAVQGHRGHGAAGVERGARWNAHGGMVAVLAARVREGGAGRGQRIEVRRAHTRVAQGTDGVGALVVGDGEDEVLHHVPAGPVGSIDVASRSRGVQLLCDRKRSTASLDR